MKVNELLTENNDGDIVQKFANENGIFSKSAIDALYDFSQYHGGYLDEILKGPDKDANIFAGEKVIPFNKFIKLAKQLKTLIATSKKEELLNSTRHIQEIEDGELLNNIKAYVKDYNKNNPNSKMQLQIFNRPPNKDHSQPYKKVWLDGPAQEIAKFKKQFNK